MYTFNTDYVGEGIKNNLTEIEHTMLMTNVKDDYVIEFHTGIIACKAALSGDFGNN